MDTMKDTKMQPATDAVIEELHKMQATAWVYEDMLGRKCVGFERPLHRRNTHEPLFSAATHAVVMGILDRLEAAEKERDALLEACETFAEWLGREERGFVRAGNKRDTPEGERAWRDWYNENLRLCALAQEQARAAIASATRERRERKEESK